MKRPASDDYHSSNTLPELTQDVWNKVWVDNFDFSELMWLRVICKAWLTNIPQSITTINSNDPDLFSNVLDFSIFTKLTGLILSHSPTEVEFWKTQLNKNAFNMQRMNIHYYADTLKNSVLEKFSNLVSLNLSRTRKMQHLDLFSTSMLKLRVLCLEDCVMNDYIGLGFLTQLEFLSISYDDMDICTLKERAMERMIDQSICYLRNLKGLRLCRLRTNYHFLSYLKELRYLDILETRPIDDGINREFVFDPQHFIAITIPSMTNLRHLSLPKFMDDHSISLSHKQTLLTCLYVNRPVNTKDLPNLRHYRFLLKRSRLASDHRYVSHNLPKKGVSLTIDTHYEGDDADSALIHEKAGEYFTAMEKEENLSPPLPREMVYPYADSMGYHTSNSINIKPSPGQQ